DPEPYARRGDLYDSVQRWQRAVAAYHECLARDPSRTQTRLKLARCLLEMNMSAEAEPHLRRCVKEAPGEADAWFRLGECLSALGKNDESRQALERAIQCNPRHFGARRQLGELEIRAGRAEEAFKWVAPLKEDWPDDSRLATTMAQTL